MTELQQASLHCGNILRSQWRLRAEAARDLLPDSKFIAKSTAALKQRQRESSTVNSICHKYGVRGRALLPRGAFYHNCGSHSRGTNSMKQELMLSTAELFEGKQPWQP